jgi:hypothetical protein
MRQGKWKLIADHFPAVESTLRGQQLGILTADLYNAYRVCFITPVYSEFPLNLSICFFLSFFLYFSTFEAIVSGVN